MSERLKVMEDFCVACGACVRIAPTLFRVAGHRIAVPRVRVVDGVAADDAREAAMVCPTEAILLIPLH